MVSQKFCLKDEWLNANNEEIGGDWKEVLIWTIYLFEVLLINQVWKSGKDASDVCLNYERLKNSIIFKWDGETNWNGLFESF